MKLNYTPEETITAAREAAEKGVSIRVEISADRDGVQFTTKSSSGHSGRHQLSWAELEAEPGLIETHARKAFEGAAINANL